MEIIGNIVLICIAIIIILITIVFAIAFCEAIYRKINFKKIQQQEFENFTNFLNSIQIEEKPKKRTTKKKETK